MTTITLSAPTLLLWAHFALLLVGILTLTLGSRISAIAHWLIWVGLIFLICSLGYESGVFFQEEIHIKTWMSGWILSRSDDLAVTVGVFQDPFGLIFSYLACLSVAGLLFSMRSFKNATSIRSISALAISASGVGLASISLTPWLLFAGLTLTILGGLISFSSVWENDQESKVAVRFLCERASGFLISFFGACVLASSKVSLVLSPTVLWTTSAGDQNTVRLGALLLTGGLFMQMQSFPFVGRLVLDSRIFPPLRILVAQIFPTWVAFILLVRLEPQLVDLGLFPVLGWVALASSALTIVSGLFQKDWRGSLSLWLVAGFSLACALLGFSGKLPAICILLGVSFAGLAISGTAAALDSDVPLTMVNKKRAVWVKVVLFFAAAAGTGLLGFVSAAGGLHWIAGAVELPAELTLFLMVLFSFVLLGWHLAWRVARLNHASSITWGGLASSAFWVLISLGVIWTGTGSGGAVPDSPDRVMPSLLDGLFEKQTLVFKDSNQFVSASGFYWGVVVLAIMAAYWSTGRKEDRWEALGALVPRFARFVAGGYGFDLVMSRVRDGLVGVGKYSTQLLDEKIWIEWLPEGLSFCLSWGSQFVFRLDKALSKFLAEGTRRLVEVPGKTLQLIHTGDLRWYLFFALGTGFALLAHYLRM